MEESQGTTQVLLLLLLLLASAPFVVIVVMKYVFYKKAYFSRPPMGMDHTPIPAQFTPEEFKEMKEAAERQFGGLGNMFTGAVQCDTPRGIEARQKELAPYFLNVREKLVGSVVSGTSASVSVVGDVSFLDYKVHNRGMVVCTVFSVKFSDGKFGVVGHVDGEFSVLQSSAPDCKIVLENLSRMPSLERDDGSIKIWFAKDRYIVANYNFALRQWEPNGMGWSGCRAQKKFAEHGITCSLEHGTD